MIRRKPIGEVALPVAGLKPLEAEARAEGYNFIIGRTPVAVLIDHARAHFRCVRLRAESPDAARLYERMGFVPIDSPDATHLLPLENHRS